MINWKFDPDNVDEQSFEPLPVGDYRVRIEEIEEKQGANFPYYALTLKVSRDNRKLWHNLVFMSGEKNGKDLSTITNTNLKKLWDSFGIEEGDLNPDHWVGKVGACRVKHEMYNGEAQARVSYFIKRDKQNHLPPWQEDAPTPPLTIDNDFSLLDEDDDIPF